MAHSAIGGLKDKEGEIGTSSIAKRLEKSIGVVCKRRKRRGADNTA